MNKIVHLIFLTILVFAFNPISAQNRPNVLFIAVDDLRPELGCYGNDIIKSPNIDKLANVGRVFNNHFVQAPTCGASRHSMLTSMYPKSQHELSNHITYHYSEDGNPESFVHALKMNGYYTLNIGKISHSADGYVYGYTEQVSDKKEMPNSWDEICFNNGKWGTGWNAFFGYANGENRQSMNKMVKPYECGDVDDYGYPDGLSAKLAITKLKELKDKGQPFFLGLGFFKPHLPFTAPKKYWDLYNESDLPLSPVSCIPENVNKKSLHSSGELNGYKLGDEKAGLDYPVSDEYARKLTHAYYASISYIDAQIGKVIEELKKLGLYENTIIVIWGDHGWHLGDQLVWGKHTLFENALRSTLIIKTPEMKKSGVSTDGIVESIDIYPTLMDLCDLESPSGIDGKSFIRLLRSPSKKGKRAAYGYFNKGITIRTKDYRLTKYFREETPIIELYDHKMARLESKNIAEGNKKIVEKLMKILVKANTELYNNKK
ncbi:MAG: sulfatase [Bacteroidetes bacterium]|nr:MAG: sulfatase [Bacteroidota bacterium]RLD74115.1 MAG: sulfatase [Bacteroidota bacterium]